MNSLGECYAMGRGVPRDLETAMEWYRRAAELGEAMADYNMGWHLEQAGKLSEAYAHYRKAADGNDDSACGRWGVFMKTASSLRRTERKRAAAMKLARNWAV